MTLEELGSMIDHELSTEGNKEIHIYDSHGETIENPEFGLGLRGLDEFTFFRESNHETRI